MLSKKKSTPKSTKKEEKRDEAEKQDPCLSMKGLTVSWGSVWRPESRDWSNDNSMWPVPSFFAAHAFGGLSQAPMAALH